MLVERDMLDVMDIYFFIIFVKFMVNYYHHQQQQQPQPKTNQRSSSKHKQHKKRMNVIKWVILDHHQMNGEYMEIMEEQTKFLEQ